MGMQLRTAASFITEHDVSSIRSVTVVDES